MTMFNQSGIAHDVVGKVTQGLFASCASNADRADSKAAHYTLQYPNTPKYIFVGGMFGIVLDRAAKHESE